VHARAPGLWRLDYGEPSCIAFGGLRVDDLVEAALLAVVQPAAIQAACDAEAQAVVREGEARAALVRDLEAAQYTADRAFRQYDAADPENRLVAGELEARWNRALERVAETLRRIADHDVAAAPRAAIAPMTFDTLAEDLPTVWSAPTTDTRLKKRIVRTVIQEVIADLDETSAEIMLAINWVGGAHTEHRLPRRRRGQRNSTPADIVEAVRVLALIAKDDVIAVILNRNGLVTGNGNRWTRERVTAMRGSYRIPVYRPAEDGIRALAQPDTGRFRGWRHCENPPSRRATRRHRRDPSAQRRTMALPPDRSRWPCGPRAPDPCPDWRQSPRGTCPKPRKSIPFNSIARCALR
jgi:hypothetical protein